MYRLAVYIFRRCKQGIGSTVLSHQYLTWFVQLWHHAINLLCDVTTRSRLFSMTLSQFPHRFISRVWHINLKCIMMHAFLVFSKAFDRFFRSADRLNAMTDLILVFLMQGYLSCGPLKLLTVLFVSSVWCACDWRCSHSWAFIVTLCSDSTVWRIYVVMRCIHHEVTTILSVSENLWCLLLNLVWI